MTFLMVLVLVCAAIPFCIFVSNLFFYREPSRLDSGAALSVLIPARNEERSITGAVESVLASRGVTLELIVMDDGSTDGTAETVARIAERDPRLRIIFAPPLPHGWNGKQHACHALGAIARHDLLCFLDADVRVAPDALSRMAGFLQQSRSDLVSGVPHEITVTFLERLLLPMIHFVLLGYLPLVVSRAFPSSPGLAAGCGQFLMVRRHAYRRCGGHGSIRASMHDGLLLPQMFRRLGFRTGLADLTSLAECRMYQNGAEVWNGLSKNATEGMAAPGRILPFTILLVFGQVLPAPLLLCSFVTPSMDPWRVLVWAALIASYAPRLIAAVRFRQSILSALLHPVGVATLVALQWCALLRKTFRGPVVWRGRAYT